MTEKEIYDLGNDIYSVISKFGKHFYFGEIVHDDHGYSDQLTQITIAFDDRNKLIEIRLLDAHINTFICRENESFSKSLKEVKEEFFKNTFCSRCENK